ncbi:MAG TPA: hypothetical protein VFU48_05075 [Nitrospira sp.]|nr:hypothetical protein [Nitrospira sp.]
MNMKTLMSQNGLSYIFVLLTIAFTVYGQLIIKWQVSLAGPLPNGVAEKCLFLIKLIFNPWILSALFAAFLGAISWMGAVAKLDLSTAYPFMALNFVLVAVFAGIFFGEAITWQKVISLILIIGALIIGGRS